VPTNICPARNISVYCTAIERTTCVGKRKRFPGNNTHDLNFFGDIPIRMGLLSYYSPRIYIHWSPALRHATQVLARRPERMRRHLCIYRYYGHLPGGWRKESLQTSHTRATHKKGNANPMQERAFEAASLGEFKYALVLSSQVLTRRQYFRFDAHAFGCIGSWPRTGSTCTV